MKNKKTILSLFVINFFSLALLSAQNESVIKITKGQTDTVSVKQHVIVGLAPLNSEIKIDGKIVKQYKTGAFGDEIVLKDGDIIESGTHEELLAKKGFYADLYNSQFEQAS